MTTEPNPKFTLTFLGGASSIGASSLLVEALGTRLLVDCGVRLNAANPLPDLSLLGTKPVDAVIVTHAHFDHTGALPLIADTYRSAALYATPPTVDLATILLRDAVRLMDGPDAERDIPLYTPQQVDACISHFVPLPYGVTKEIGGLGVTLSPASHILGAAMVHIATPAGTILVTGDYSVEAGRTVPALARPSLHADLVVSESTYGQRLHEDRRAAEERLIAQIRAVVERKGTVLVPAFAIGRAQEVLLIIKRGLRSGSLPPVPVYVDGMVKSVCAVYGAWPSYVTRALAYDIAKAEHPFYTNGIVPVMTPAERAGVLQGGPCVIVASSGMLTGGASAAYAAALAGDERNAILITGYQDEESPGRALLALADHEGPREVRIGGQTVAVKCSVEKYGLSAHADRMQLVGLIESQRPRAVALVHGDEEARTALAKGLSCRDVVLPKEGAPLSWSFPLRRPPVSGGFLDQTFEDLDIERARHVLGPPSDAPVAAAKIALAWFGRKAPAAAVERLAIALESAKLIRRDDHRRSMLWVLSPTESGLFPSEAVLEEEMKKANPKGRLLEWCMRRRIPMPLPVFSSEGAWHVAELTVDALSSGPCKAASRKTAEQCAARSLLLKIEAANAKAEDIFVDDAQAEALKSNNAKGRLLELCARQKYGVPEFLERAVVDGFVVSASIKVNDRTFAGRSFRSSTAKTAQQAAAEDLLHQIGELQPDKSVAGPVDERAIEKPVVIDRRGDLNGLRQQNVIRDYGYEVAGKEGPDHRPSFIMTAWAEIDGGKRIETGQVRAESKKEGTLYCAAALWDKLKDAGLVGS